MAKNAKPEGGQSGTRLRSSARQPADGAVNAYLASYQRLHRFLTRRVGCSANAADILQETYLRLARTSVPVDNPSAYVGRVAVNIATDWQRADARERTRGAALRAEPVPEAPSTERLLLGRERLEQVLGVADRLPPKCREVFVLRKIEGLEQQEIAARLGISMNMVQKHLRKALADIEAALALAE